MLKHRKLWRKHGHVSIEGACEDPERLRNWFEFENSRASLTACGPRRDRSTKYRNGRRNEQDSGAGCIKKVQADTVHIDADKEILAVNGKIAALEAQSADVHDESNARQLGTASALDESSGSQVATKGAA